MSEVRPDPDALLAAIRKEEERQSRGQLKIFFGMAAGVGKTYAMLDAARRLKAEGVDVVVGYVETHKRAETEALLHGLEIVPRQQLQYRGTVLEEMDIDAILDRNPTLVLVDELAHTNAEGARHPKRYQDVLELLNAGIDVYTTVNVQHIESRTDTVRQITGITVRETVPDSVFEVADEIELIDLAPEELRKRLAEGKVYTPERSETAARNFFRVGNLTALREMALRLTAERVDHQLQDYMQAKQIAGPWKSRERLMVAVSPSPLSEKLVRWTRRMAYNLEAPWLAVYVEQAKPISDENRAQLLKNLALARELGGEVITVTGDNMIDTMMSVAHQHNVTQIVVGKPARPAWQEFLSGGSIVNRLIRSSGEVDIYVVQGEKGDSAPRPVLPPLEHHSTWKQYALALLVVALVTIFNFIIAVDVIGYQAVGLTELFAVMLIAVYIGRGPALLAAAVGALSWDVLFIPPQWTLIVSRPEDAVLLVLYFVIALFTGNLTARIRSQERLARYHAERTTALYTLAREVARASSIDDVLRTAVKQIGQSFNAEIAIFLRSETGHLDIDVHPMSTLNIDDKDFSAAVWTFENARPAGRFTDTLPFSSAQFLPLLTSGGVVGVLGLRTRQEERLTLDQEALLQTFTSQVALVIEREMLDEAEKRAEMLTESERLYTALLNSISHELRTPIATITGAASSLESTSNVTTRQVLITDIREAADRLNRLVENLLDMSRLESGRLKLKLDWCDVGDLIGVAASRVEGRMNDRKLTIDIAQDLPLIKLDCSLIEQVFVNLLDNAAAYTPAGTTVQVDAFVENGELYVSILDKGAGIPHDDLERIFEKFYRVPGTATGGTGLGLSISKGLIEAHGGRITAENRPSGGARFTIRLPINATPPPAQEAKL
jgi:two-component system sensor histidine kinase KdpD